jgi:hypothetical protein
MVMRLIVQQKALASTKEAFICCIPDSPPMSGCFEALLSNKQDVTALNPEVAEQS